MKNSYNIRLYVAGILLFAISSVNLWATSRPTSQPTSQSASQPTTLPVVSDLQQEVLHLRAEVIRLNETIHNQIREIAALRSELAKVKAGQMTSQKPTDKSKSSQSQFFGSGEVMALTSIPGGIQVGVLLDDASGHPYVPRGSTASRIFVSFTVSNEEGLSFRKGQSINVLGDITKITRTKQDYSVGGETGTFSGENLGGMVTKQTMDIVTITLNTTRWY